MKKQVMTLLLVVLLLCITPNTVHADMGPKAKLEITVIGVSEPYHFDVLIYKEDDILQLEDEELYYYYDEAHFPAVLRTYQDDTNYASYALYKTPASVKQVEENVFEMNYIAPDKFRVAIVLDGTDFVISSEIVSTNRFESSVVWDLSGVELTSVTNHMISVGEVSGNIVGYDDGRVTNDNWFITVTNTFYRVIATLFIELCILLLMGFRKRDTVKVIVVTNVITQVTLSALVIMVFLTNGPFAYILALLFLEIVVLIAEAITYLKLVKEKSPGIVLLYAFLANIASLVVSFLMLYLL